jgi:hypothetical protein
MYDFLIQQIVNDHFIVAVTTWPQVLEQDSFCKRFQCIGFPAGTSTSTEVAIMFKNNFMFTSVQSVLSLL